MCEATAVEGAQTGNLEIFQTEQLKNKVKEFQELHRRREYKTALLVAWRGSRASNQIYIVRQLAARVGHPRGKLDKYRLTKCIFDALTTLEAQGYNRHEALSR